MKKILTILFFASALAATPLLLTTGCNTSQQTLAYKSIYTVQKVTVGAYDGYLDQVINGTARTNEVPRVSKAFNHFQASFLVALDAVQFNTNALAPASLVLESQDIINLITQIKGNK